MLVKLTFVINLGIGPADQAKLNVPCLFQKTCSAENPLNRIFAVLIACCCLAPPLLQAQTMSHEEVVRNAYAKLSFMCGLPPVSHTAFMSHSSAYDPHGTDVVALDAAIAKATPVFSLTNFRTGSIAEIAHEPLSRFVTLPSFPGQVLDAVPNPTSYDDWGNKTSWVAATVVWQRSQASASGSYPDDFTVAKALAQGEFVWSDFKQPVTFISYVSYTVDAAFQGKSTGPHAATVWFGHDAEGKEVFTVSDPISGPGILHHILETPAYPTAFLTTSEREIPVVAAWVRSHGMPSASCSVPARTLCCAGGRCGISQDDLNRDLAAPFPKPKTPGGQH